MDKKTAKALDKYYTKPEIARECLNIFVQHITDTALIVEPSAGNGSFLHSDRPMLGLDLYPESSSIIQHDFLVDDLSTKINLGTEMVFLGNPPFGRKGDLAVDFINTALTHGSVVGFILPVQFRKWSAQKRIQTTAKLIVDHDLPSDAFTFCGSSYDLRCSFQIWATNSNLPDLRLKTSPPIAHEDFSMWQFNRTDEAAKYFDYDWDFAVPRQGYNDYNYKAFKKEDCDRKKQWIFFKAHNQVALEKLLSLDFVELSKLNSGIPGFGKADIVQHYNNARLP